jgi:TPR repeat protein
MSSRFALVIGNTEYTDPKLARLRSPIADVDDFSRVLREPELGAFDDVSNLVNQPKSVVEKRISALFLGKQPNDLLLLYFSGHGVRDEDGQLYLAVSDTDHAELDGTAVIASFIKRVMNKSSSRRQILILDCCHSGAFSSGFKGAKGEEVGTSVGTKSVFETPGYGRIILTASDATQYAWEGDQVIGEAENSLYTHFLIQGMRTGEADVRGSGRITVDELHDYAYQQVVARTSKQRPQRFGAKEEGQLVLSKAPLKMAELPVDIRNALRSDFPGLRQAAIKGLLDMVRNSAPGQVLAAHAALTRLLDDDSLSIRKLAREAINSYTANDLQIGQGVLDKVANEAREQKQPLQSTIAAAGQAPIHAMSDKVVPQTSGETTSPAVVPKEEDEQQESRAPSPQEAEQVAKRIIGTRETDQVSAATADVPTSDLSHDQPSAEKWSKYGYYVFGAIMLLLVILVLASIGNPGPDKSSSGPQPTTTSAENAPSAAEMFNTGENYYYGRGVNRDYKQARDWYQKAADAGDSNGMFSVAFLYDKGLGVKKDYQQALFWYRKAADAGNSTAMFNLGVAYWNGEGVLRDDQQARFWFQKAAGAGDKDAKKWLREHPG